MRAREAWGTTLEWIGPISGGTGTGSRDADWRASSRTEGGGRSLAEDKRTEGELEMPWRMRVCQQEWSRVRHAERKLPTRTSGFRRGCSIRASDWIHRRVVSRRTVTGSELYSRHVL